MFKFIALICLVCFIVNIEALSVSKKSCTGDKMVPADEFNAVKETLEIVRKESIGDIYSSTVGDKKVWAQAKCLAPGDCRPCVKQLIDEIYKICNDMKEVEVTTPDCYLKYSFSEF